MHVFVFLKKNICSIIHCYRLKCISIFLGKWGKCRTTNFEFFFGSNKIKEYENPLKKKNPFLGREQETSSKNIFYIGLMKVYVIGPSDFLF